MLWCILRKVGGKLGKILKELKENEGKILEGMKEWKFPGLIATRDCDVWAGWLYLTGKMSKPVIKDYLSDR